MKKPGNAECRDQTPEDPCLIIKFEDRVDAITELVSQKDEFGGEDEEGSKDEEKQRE